MPVVSVSRMLHRRAESRTLRAVAELTAQEVLTTTRAVRRKLDLERPVDPMLIRECLEVALQAPTGGNNQDWQFVVVTDPETRRRLGDVYRKGGGAYAQLPKRTKPPRRSLTDDEKAARGRVMSSSGYLFEHMQDVPVLVVACIDGRFDGAPVVEQATVFGSIYPAVWSFMLAARARGLGTAWTTVHTAAEEEAAEILGIPYDEVTQVALIPVAHVIGDPVKPAVRRSVDEVAHFEHW
jgi:nitroreductase